MALKRVSMINWQALPESGRFFSPISTQLTLANADVGERNCLVLSEDASDTGIHASFNVPLIYVSTPRVVVKGIIDGAPGAADIMAFTYQHLALDDKEGVDTAFQAADLGSVTIGSNDQNYADEDHFVFSFALVNNTQTALDQLHYKFQVDISVNTFAGNYLITSLEHEFDDGV